MRTGELMVDMGVLTAAQLDICLAKQRLLVTEGKHVPLGEIAVRYRFCTRSQTQQAVAQTTSGRDRSRVLLRPVICARYQVVPAHIADNSLVVRTARGLTDSDKRALIAACEMPVTGIKVQAIDLATLQAELAELSAGDLSFSVLAQRLRHDDTGHLLRLAIEAMLGEALEARASDIHLDRTPGDSWVSYRVDSVLRQMHLLPDRTMAAIMTRLKSEAGMDASNSLLPQDGRLSMPYKSRNIDFRMATQPIAGGETIALRVLDADVMPSLEEMFPNQLGMYQLFRNIAHADGKRGGIILTVGTTGSGKTTTLYSLASLLPRDRVNLMTVEDPVEYSLPFARQIQLNQLLGQKAGDFERSLLRQDPDVIMMGEIRDAASASAALKFSESGHMVLATLHAESALSVFERVAGFFDGPAKDEALYVLAQQLHVVLHQRLIPRLCTCAYQLDPETTAQLAQRAGLTIKGHAKHRGTCPACNGTGMRGRVLSHETLIIPRKPMVRSAVFQLLQTGLASIEKLPEVPGVQLMTRDEVHSRLIEEGLLDFETVEEQSV
jgi:type II secretory ATPase GspE/PulE/Tfp pilus assembly ATPase PilB-like protein